jgi:hypothetical protein
MRLRTACVCEHGNSVSHCIKPTKCTLTLHLISHLTATCIGVHDAILRECTKFSVVISPYQACLNHSPG